MAENLRVCACATASAAAAHTVACATCVAASALFAAAKRSTCSSLRETSASITVMVFCAAFAVRWSIVSASCESHRQGRGAQ
jgi:hypothetical protein